MKKDLTFLYFFIISIFLTPSIYAVKTTDPDEWQKRLKSYEKLSEDKVNMADIALDLAQEIFPSLDKERYHSTLDTMAKEVKKLIGNQTDPEYRIRALNTYLFKIKGYRYDYSDPIGENLENRYLVGILEKGKGGCVSLPLIYVILAQKLGFPIYAVSAPDHFFVRYVDRKLKRQNIEATNAGAFSPKSRYIQDFKIPKIALENGSYLKSMSYREYTGSLIAQNAVVWGRKGITVRARLYAETAKKLNPFSPEIDALLATVYFHLLQKERADLYQLSKLHIANQDQIMMAHSDIANHYRRLNIDFQQKAKSKGLVRLPRDEYIKNFSKKKHGKEIKHSRLLEI